MKRATGKEDEADHRHYEHSPRNRRTGGMPIDSLKEVAVWHVEPLLCYNCERSNYAKSITRHRLINRNRRTVFSLLLMLKYYKQGTL
jgi:hypothetical protein